MALAAKEVKVGVNAFAEGYVAGAVGQERHRFALPFGRHLSGTRSPTKGSGNRSSRGPIKDQQRSVGA